MKSQGLQGFRLQLGEGNFFKARPEKSSSMTMLPFLELLGLSNSDLIVRGVVRLLI